ncbi:glycosyltransferase family 2 protein [Microbacterium sp. MC2]
MKKLVVAIATFRRPDGIAAALDVVEPQATELNSRLDGAASATVLVVDNDPEASARSAITARGTHYVHEPRPGIAAVRNRALREAEATGAEAIVFIDDDEVPEPDWLFELTSTYLRTNADAVAGKVITVIPEGTPDWVKQSNAFVRPVRSDGQSIPEAATNNLLLDLTTLRRLDIEFDEAFGLSGGSDSMLTLLLTTRGGVIRWAENAVVIEREDPTRFTRSWVLARFFRFGNTSARVRIALAGSTGKRIRVRLACFGQGLVRCVATGVLVLVGLLTRSLRRRAQAERQFARGAGLIAGAIGYTHDEYGRRRRQPGS